LAEAIRTSVDSLVVAPLLRTIEDHPLELLSENPDCPIRVVWAERDRIVPFAHFGQPLIDRLPGAELLRVAGIGHVPMYDEPGEVARLILEVAASCDAPEESAS
jgi:pimeloyl-ACP methyl ester carboxylesterase